MADENKKVSAENTKPAKQVKDKKAEKPAKTAKVKDKKPNVFVRMGRSIKKFFKELRGESKKVVWPDRKTVLKSSLVVIVSVVSSLLLYSDIDETKESVKNKIKKTQEITYEKIDKDDPIINVYDVDENKKKKMNM